MQTAHVERQIRWQRGAEVPMQVTVQGAVLVNNATVERDYGDCLLVAVDLHSKHATLECTSHNSDGGPAVYLGADEYTLYLDDNQPRDLATVIEFPTYQGWRIFSASEPARYTLALTLLAPKM